MQHETEHTTQGRGALVQFRPGPRCKLDEDAEALDRTLHTIRLLSSWDCTQEEIAAALRVSKTTLTRFLQRNEDGRLALEEGRLAHTSSLRRKQFEVAMAGNVPMLIWLGKQRLGQRDKMDLAANLNAPSHEDELDQLE